MTQLTRRRVAQGLAWTAPAIAAAAAAPAFAVSPSQTLAYRVRGSIYTSLVNNGFGCRNTTYGRSGLRLSSLSLSNQVSIGTSPLGFSIVEMPRTDGSGLSPRTTATLANPVQLVVAYPSGMVANVAQPFTFTNGTGANWSAPTRRTATLTSPDGITQTYDVFTFTWLGNRSQSTTQDRTASGTRPTSWAGTALTGSWAVNTSYCAVDTAYYLSNYYSGGTAAALGRTAGSYGTFTTANGYTGLVVSNSPSTGGWIAIN